MLISTKTCFKCRSPFIPGIKAGKYLHSCKWSPADKCQTRCRGQNGSKPCYFAAATCLVHKNNVSRELESWLAKSKIKVDSLVEYEPTISEDFEEKEKLIEFLKSESGNLDTILPSYQNRRKQEKLKLVKKIGNEMSAEENAKHIDDKDTAPLNNKTIKITGKERMKKSDFDNF